MFIKLLVLVAAIGCINQNCALAQMSEDTSYEDGCYIAFDDEELDYNTTSLIVDQCLEKYPLSSDESNEMEEIDNQYNCALKCINENLNATTKDGRLDIDKLKEDFSSSNATEAYASKLVSLLDSCASDTEKKLSESGGYKSNLCKYHVMVMQCYADAYKDAREEIQLLC
ncbi:unnamed protein product [Orchesella dallaii]|uniref:Uncharacterized protein n=1 Tax=Orchesella dallaii TaxID=48710 RepID=A0ABP1QV11_9HEXA